MATERAASNVGIAGGRAKPPSGVYETREPHLYFGWGRRLPMIYQSEAAECGLACLAMIAGYYGQREDLAQLRRRLSVSLKGITLATLIEIAGSLGLACRPFRLDLDELHHLQTPCILHWDLDHFVVLRHVGRRRVTIHDPAVGVRALAFDEIGPHWTGIAVELSKGPTFKRMRPPPPVSLRKLAGSIHGLGKALWVIFSLALLLELAELLWPQFLQVVIDQVLADGDHGLLTLLALGFLLLLAMETVVSALRTWTVMWLGTHFDLSWAGNVFQHLMRLPQDYFLKRHLGDIVSRFGAVSVMEETVTSKFVGVILDGVMASLALAVMVVYSPMLTGIVVLSLAVYAVSRVLYYRVYFESNLSQITTQAKQQSVFMEAVRGVQTIRLHNRTGAHTSRYLNATADSLNTSIAVQKLDLLFGSINSLTSGLQRVGILWLGAYLTLGGSFTAGMLMAYIAYASQLTSRASSLIDYVVQLKLMRLQAERLADIVLTAPEAYTESQWAGPLPEPAIRFEKVSFRFGLGEPWIIRDCSFEVVAGETVAITGPSGSGKSTLVRLMLGLLDPQQGRITIGGVDIKKLGKRTWRGMVGSVMQDDTLFAGCIADNISFHDEAATPEKVEAAARLAQIHDDIVTLPMGYNTLVGDMGSTLSGGQRQRVFLARALYKKPTVLVLDEATNQLDVMREHKITEALKDMSLTRVIISHRRETIIGADKLLVCVNGQVRAMQHKQPNTTIEQGARSSEPSAIPETEFARSEIASV